MSSVYCLYFYIGTKCYESVFCGEEPIYLDLLQMAMSDVLFRINKMSALTRCPHCRKVVYQASQPLLVCRQCDILLNFSMLPLSFLEKLNSKYRDTIIVIKHHNTSFRLHVMPSDSIYNVKQQIHKRLGLKPRAQSLYIQGKKLRNCHTVRHYEIVDHCKLHLFTTCSDVLKLNKNVP